MVRLAAQTPPTGPADQFYAAIRSGDVAQVRTLLQHGADVNVKDRRGGATPLMHAAAVGSFETMQALLEKGADIHLRSAGGATALMWAATDLAKIRLLLDRGADVNAVSNTGRSVLLLAAMSDQSAQIVRLLLARHADPKVVDADKVTTLVAATIGNDIDTIRQLVDVGVDVNAADGTGQTPLMVAASNGHLEAVKLLLARGANVNAVSGPPSNQVKNGVIALGRFTALHLAASNGTADVVKALLAGGAEINVKDARGLTPLMIAVATDHGNLETIKTLIARRADVQAKSLDGETALDWAQKSGSTASVTALKQAGAVAAAAMPAHPIPAPTPTTHRPAVERGVTLLERSSGTFFVNSACGACHAQNVTDFATMAARRRGIGIDAAGAAQRANGAAGAFGAIAPRIIERADGPSIDIFLYTLGGLAAANDPADRATDALVFNVSAQQRRDGAWHQGGIARPPIEDGDFSRTALAVRALTVYGPAGRGPDMKDRAQKGVAWLRSATPLTAEDRAFRLLGLHWGGADANTRRQAAREIVATQRGDGGWSQRQEMDTDPYATGLTLFSLMESASLTNADPAVERGIRYLLATQRMDGSWHVRSRSLKFQPYFEGGFPYGHDQWISAMATGWATAALAAGLPEADGSVH
jgi:ankyrin repeat protein